MIIAKIEESHFGAISKRPALQKEFYGETSAIDTARISNIGQRSRRNRVGIPSSAVRGASRRS